MASGEHTDATIFGPHQQHRPLVYTPITRMSEHWFTYSDTKCAKFEKLLFQCAYQGSRSQMYKHCAKQLEDFEECIFEHKQAARYTAIQNERKKKQKYEQVPLPGIYQ